MLNLTVINNLKKITELWGKKWQNSKQNYTAKFDRSVVETDRPIIIMAHLYITFPEIDGTRQKISKSTDSWTHMIELHN